jgi:hypothetical protein
MKNKYRYVFKEKDENHFEYSYYDLEEVENGKAISRIDCMLNAGFILISRDRYTGLKTSYPDKEIYENDILKGISYLYGYELASGKQFDYYGYVKWQDQCDVGLCWTLDNGGGAWNLNQLVHRNMIDYCTGEIVGNMHENPNMFLEQSF